MRIQDIAGTIQDNFYLAFILVATLAVILGIIYFIIYKKILKGNKKLSKRRVFIWLCFIGYIIMVIGVTFIGRGVRLDSDSNLHFLSTYREAWNSFCLRVWQPIFLNIIMLVPFGMLLPLLDKRFYKLKWIFGASLLLTLTIEIMQLITGYGVFDIDDIFNNIIGAIIGYGIVMAIIALIKDKGNRKNKFKRSVIYLIPLILVITLSIAVVEVYNSKEFGNLFITYNYKFNMKNIDLSLNTEIITDTKEVFLNDNNKYRTEEVPIYKAKVYDGNYGEEFFKDFLKDKDIDEEIEVDPYNDMAIYWSRGEPNYNMTFDYNGGKYDYRDFSSFDEGIETTDTDKKTIIKKLAEFDISVPKSAVFSKPDDEHEVGVFQWTIENYIDGDYITNGVLSARYYNDDTIKGITNNIVKYKKIKDISIKSKEEAYRELEQGKFRVIYIPEDIKKIEVEDINLSYMLDTKGFYQPIYNFESKIDGEPAIIFIPAL